MGSVESNKYYVYIYLDPRKPGVYKYGDLEFEFEPFYVGEGYGDRLFAHLKQAKYNSKGECNNYKRNKIKSILNEDLEPIILVLHSKLTKLKAGSLERAIIKKIGRFLLKEGPLTNIQDGPSFENKQTKETREKIKISRGDFKHSETSKLKISISGKNRNFKHSQEAKARISLAHKGKTLSRETKEKLRNFHIGKPLSAEHRANIGKGLLGGTRVISEAQRNKASLVHKGKVYTEEHKKRLSQISLDRPQIQCPHCKGYFNAGNLKFYHLDKCKNKNNITWFSVE